MPKIKSRKSSSRTSTRGRSGTTSGSRKKKASSRKQPAENVTFIFVEGGPQQIDFSEITRTVDELKKLDTIEAIEERLEQIGDEKGETFRSHVALGITPHVLNLGLRFTQTWVSGQVTEGLKFGKQKAEEGIKIGRQRAGQFLGFLSGVLNDLNKTVSGEAESPSASSGDQCHSHRH